MADSVDTSIVATKEGEVLDDNGLLIIRLWSSMTLIGRVLGHDEESGDILLGDGLFLLSTQTQNGQQVLLNPLDVPGMENPDRLVEGLEIRRKEMMYVDTVSTQMAEAFEKAWVDIKASKQGLVIAPANALKQ